MSSSTATAASLSAVDDPEVSEEINKQENTLASGIVAVMAPVVLKIDERITAARSSQISLRTQIDKLAEELRSISNEYPSPYDLEPYIKKLQDSKKRIAVVNSILQNSQDRLSRLHANIAKETAKRKVLIEAPIPSPPTQS